MKIVDKNYCMSYYLAFRFIKDENINFYPNLHHSVIKPYPKESLKKIFTVDELDQSLNISIKNFYLPDKTALFLSGGIDSAILASYLPAGTKAYTFKCIAENAKDETVQAKKYCDYYGLKHEIVEMYWNDFEELTPLILQKDQVPFHSIEVQLLKAITFAKKQGIQRILIGESADLVFGGMDKLLMKDWGFDEFIQRYNFCNPEDILSEPHSVSEFYEPYRLANNKIDFLSFVNNEFAVESTTSYFHAFNIARVEYYDPYSHMMMGNPLDLERIRNGEPKYLLRELFAKRYPDLDVPDKIPMPRAMDQWLKNWYGTSRPEFVSGCTQNLSGDQKWQCWCLEKFLNMYEP